MATVKKISPVYSKKSGIKNLNITLIKDVSMEEAIDYVKVNFGKDITKEKECQIPGFLYPSLIKIIGK